MAAQTPLFGSCDGSDRIHNELRVPRSDNPDLLGCLIRGREFSENLWQRTCDYVDADLPRKATEHFHQCFWEMYLAATFLERKLPLVPRARRAKALYGPDLQIDPNIWVEAIAVTAGTGPDFVPSMSERPPEMNHGVPEDQLRLRLIAGVTEKRGKFERYKRNGLVGPNDICVIAINDALLPLYSEMPPSRIVACLLELGGPQIRIDLVSKKVVGHTFDHRPSITKKSLNSGSYRAPLTF